MQVVLLERYVHTYELSDRKTLGAISALVRFMDEPQKLGIEWKDGNAPSLFVSPARDDILAAILDVAQVG